MRRARAVSSTFKSARIFFDVTGMNGSRLSATMRRPSTRLARICATRGSLSGSLASVNGEVDDDVFVGRVERLPNGFQRAIERELFHLSGDARGQRGEGLAQRNVEGITAAGRCGDGAFEVSRRHREHAAGQVAEVVGQVRVVAIDHALFGEVAVEAVGEFAQDEKTQHVRRRRSAGRRRDRGCCPSSSTGAHRRNSGSRGR